MIVVQRQSTPQSPLFFWSAPGTRTLATDKAGRSANHGLPALLGSVSNFETITVVSGYNVVLLPRLHVLLTFRKTSPLPPQRYPFCALQKAQPIHHKHVVFSKSDQR